MTPSADVYLKRADTLPTGAFKVRDGVTVISRLGEEFHDPDLIAASTGNHGQSVAYAGRVFDDARERAEALAAERGYQYVHSANKPALVAGVGTARLEVVEELPGVDYLFSPVGGGGAGATGYCLTVGELTDADVISVQLAAAPAIHRAWSEGHLDPTTGWKRSLEASRRGCRSR